MIYDIGYKKKSDKRIYRIFVAIVVVAMLFCNLSPVFARIYPPNLPTSYLSDTFPDSYKAYVDKVKKDHPNWIVKALYTGLDWNQAISHESFEVSKGISTINKNDYGPEWLYQGSDPYNDGPYYTASKQAVAYTMDPRNFLNSKGIFQFETLSYSELHTVETVQKLLSNTPMGSNEYKNKYKKAGKWVTMDKTYAQIIFNVSKKYGVSPIHVASRIKQENSGNILSNELLTGSTSGYEGYYNFFNIGAYPANGNSSVKNGLIHAKNNGWSTPELAIDAGVDLLKNKYIKWGQDTIYFQKFDVNNPKGQAEFLYGPPYMTNIMAPTNEGTIMYNAYNSAGLLEEKFVFNIPVYNNMPTSPAPMPTEAGTYFNTDSNLIYLDDPRDSGVKDVFPIRSSPDSSVGNANLIVNFEETKDGGDNRTKFTRIGIGVNTIYDKIKFPDGRIGYVSKEWIYVYNYQKVQDIKLSTNNITLELNKSTKLIATITPSNANIKDVVWSSSDSNIVSVDANGNITAKKSGKASITATTKDQLKTATCYVDVISNIAVTSISCDKTTYTAIKDKYIDITPTIMPLNATNKDYTLTSSNTNILKVEGKKIKALAKGTATITFKTIDGSKTTTVTINVIEESEDTKITIDASIRQEGKKLSKINLGSKVSDLTSKIKYNTNLLNVEIKDASGKVMAVSEVIGTGTTVNVKIKSTNSVIETYTVIIYGDISGDGKIDSMDMFKLRQHLLGNTILKDITLNAANTSKDSENKIDSMDMFNLRQHLLGNKLVQQ